MTDLRPTYAQRKEALEIAESEWKAAQDSAHTSLDFNADERLRLYMVHKEALWALVTCPIDLRTPEMKALNAQGIKTGNAVNEPSYQTCETQLDPHPLSRGYDNPLQGQSLFEIMGRKGQA